MTRTPPVSRIAAGAGALALIAVAGLSGAAFATTTTTAPASTVNVVGYSVVGPAFKALEADFQATPAGHNVTFANAFGASDTETQDVVNGQSADLVNLSYPVNISTLVAADKVPVNWTTQEKVIGHVNVALSGANQQTVYPTPGILTDSVVVFVVRKGNPLGIKTWADVVKGGVQIVTPNPATSGSAKWNLLAAYAAQLSLGKTPHQAQNFLKTVLSHTIAQPPSGSSALAAFVAGTGNVLLDYEDDALAAIAAGQPVSIVTPPQTILIENPVALTGTGLQNPGALAFYRYLFSVPAQEVLARLGYRSVLTPVWNATKSTFPAFKRSTDLLRVRQINKLGWPSVDPEFFSPTVAFPKGTTTYPDRGIVTYLEQFAGSAG